MDRSGHGYSPPLEACCVEARRARIPALLGPDCEASIFAPMLYDLVSRHTPNRLQEIHQTLFGAMFRDEPFWGVYEKLLCPTCGRELHVLLIDAMMIVVVDQLTRQLYELMDTAAEDDVRFNEATAEQRVRAGKILSQTVFRTGNAPLIESTPLPGRMPQAWMTQSMTLAYVFMVIHETSHQGPPAALGTSSYAPYIGPAYAGASLYGISLSEQEALAWAKELSADVNAFIIVVTDSLKAGLREEVKVAWYRALVAGISLALKAWDLMLDEFCYGNAYLSRSLLRTHPPARWRIELLARSSQVAQRLGVMSGDRIWADRVMDALDDLHKRGGTQND
jgi:hypothetical protein